MKKATPVLLFLLLLSFGTLFAQGSGRITGTVTDVTTGTPLFGANVFLKGVSIGAATDLDGKYTITQIPAGDYLMAIRYIGYQEKELEVTVQANKTIVIDIEIEAEVIEGQVVEVTAQALGQKQAINQQLAANTIKNIVSSEKIQRLPDENAAAALSRLPGVSLMNGDQVVIRGIEAKLNQVLINGVAMPSTNMNDRSTGLGFVSSNMLSGVEVIKAITPDMDANTIGGVVNLRLKDADPGLHVDALVQGNYNVTDANTNNFKAWVSVSNRFFDDKLGVFLQGNIEKTDGGDQLARLNTYRGDNLPYGEAWYGVNGASLQYGRSIVKNSGFSLILDYKLPNGKIFFQNTYASNLTDRRDAQVNLNFAGVQGNAAYTMDRDKYGKDMWLNSLQFDNTFGDFKVEGGLAHSFTNQYTRIAYPAGMYCEFRDITSEQAPFGYDENGLVKEYNTDYDFQTMDFQKVYNIFDNLNPTSVTNATYENQPRTTKNKFDQHLYTASLDLTMPVTISKDITSIFKAGGKFVRTTRDNDFNTYFNASNDPDLYDSVLTYFPDRPRSHNEGERLRLTDVMGSYERGKNFLSDEYDFKNGFTNVINTDIFDPWLIQSFKGWDPLDHVMESTRNDYYGSESYTAAYLMGTFNILSKLTLIGGVRYERFNMKYHAQFTVTTHEVYGNSTSTRLGDYADLPWKYNNVDRVDENIFPNLQIRYKATDWLDVRAAYTEGISRPNYLSIVPKIWLYPSGIGKLEVGNPKLRPTTGRNLDLIVSIFNNEIGLFTVNGFYKELKDVSYGTSIYWGLRNEYSENDVFIPDSMFIIEQAKNNTWKLKVNTPVNVEYNNPYIGYVRGVELDWQTNFWYLPSPLNSLVLDINYTRSSSNMQYKQRRLLSKMVDRKPVYYIEDTVFVGRLTQQAKDVINVALGFDYKGFSSRISFNMRGDVLNNVGSRPEETRYTGNLYKWDLAIKQELPIDGFSVSLNGVNIFHNGIKTYGKFRRSPDAPITENLLSVRYSPTIWQLSLRYNY
ncbi:MAG: TonB-dependent receptor [Ignavibacteria bacterium]|nr:TonB-dependent receptor [Ignavibacteria bacterium]